MDQEEMKQRIIELEKQNKQLEKNIGDHKRHFKCYPKFPQYYTCPKCGSRTSDLACCMYDEEEASTDGV